MNNDLSYYRARYYDSNEGRFISEDPDGFDDGPNVFSFVQNDPANNVDPFGLATCSLRFRFGRGVLTCIPNAPGKPMLIIPVASGNNGRGKHCKNNQACESIASRGPIPHGYWQWTMARNTKANGRRLKPWFPTNTYGRDGFLSHSCKNAFGPSATPPFCSEGCVTGSPADIQRLNQLLDAEPKSLLIVQTP